MTQSEQTSSSWWGCAVSLCCVRIRSSHLYFPSEINKKSLSNMNVMNTAYVLFDTNTENSSYMDKIEVEYWVTLFSWPELSGLPMVNQLYITQDTTKLINSRWNYFLRDWILATCTNVLRKLKEIHNMEDVYTIKFAWRVSKKTPSAFIWLKISSQMQKQMHLCSLTSEEQIKTAESFRT